MHISAAIRLNKIIHRNRANSWFMLEEMDLFCISMRCFLLLSFSFLVYFYVHQASKSNYTCKKSYVNPRFPRSCQTKTALLELLTPPTPSQLPSRSSLHPSSAPSAPSQLPNMRSSCHKDGSRNTELQI